MEISRVCAFAECANSIDHMSKVAKYCSRSCGHKAKRPRPPAHCDGCAQPLARRHGSARYCSSACQQRTWRAANPGYYRDDYARHADERRAARRSYYWADPERERQKASEYRLQNPGYRREWLAQNPHKQRSYDATRRASEKAAFVEYVDPSVLWDRDHGVCHICGEQAHPDNWEVDHIVPLTPRPGEPRGEHSYANTAVAHVSCNRAKGNKPWPGGKALTTA